MQIALMKSKLPVSLHRDVILFNARRWSGDELLFYEVVDATVDAADVVPEAMFRAAALKSKGHGVARKALGDIKRLLYSDVLSAAASGGGMDLSGVPQGVDRPRRTAAPLSKL